MRQFNIRVKLPKRVKKNVAVIVPVGDVHVGSAGCSKSTLLEDIETIRWLNQHGVPTYWVGMGDYIDGITNTDKRFDGKDIDPDFMDRLDELPQAEAEWFAHAIEPIADKCLFMLEGNHEERLRAHTSVSNILESIICRPLGLRYGGYTSTARVSFGTGKTTTIFAHHGKSNAALVGSKVNVLMKMSQWVNADISLMGHVHCTAVVPTVKLDVGRKRRLHQRHHLAVITSTYLKTYDGQHDGYGSRAAYDPPVIGAPAIIIHPGEGRYAGVDDLDALRWLV